MLSSHKRFLTMILDSTDTDHDVTWNVPIIIKNSFGQSSPKASKAVVLNYGGDFPCRAQLATSGDILGVAIQRVPLASSELRLRKLLNVIQYTGQPPPQRITGIPQRHYGFSSVHCNKMRHMNFLVFRRI